MRWYSASALYMDNAAPLDDLRESVTKLEDTERTARRVLGSAHPTTAGIGVNLQNSREKLSVRESVEELIQT